MSYGPYKSEDFVPWRLIGLSKIDFANAKPRSTPSYWQENDGVSQST